MQQTLLRLKLPADTRLFPSQFREELAKQPDLPNDLFHRDADGQSINALPGVRTVGGAGWVGLCADPSHAGLVVQHIPAALRAVTKFCGRNVALELEQLEVGIARRQEPVRHWVREMVIKTRTAISRTRPLEETIALRIAASLERQCAKLGLDCPTPQELEITVHEAQRPRGLRLRTTQGVTNESVTLVDVDFSLFASLSGMWFCGNLTARGYGRIIPPAALRSRRPGTMRSEAPEPSESKLQKSGVLQ